MFEDALREDALRAAQTRADNHRHARTTRACTGIDCRKLAGPRRTSQTL